MAASFFPFKRGRGLLSPPFSLTAFFLCFCWYGLFRFFAFFLDILSPETDEVYSRYLSWILDRLNLLFFFDILPFPGLAQGLIRTMNRLNLDHSGFFSVLPWQHIVLLTLFGIFLWALFGVAVCRCYKNVLQGSSERRPVEAARSLTKSFVKCVTYAMFLAFVVVAFYFLGGLFGLLIQIPGSVGSILSLVLLPVLLLPTLMVLLIGVAGILGSGFFCSAVAFERDEGLEPFLGGFRTVYARPMCLILYGFLSALFVGIVFFATCSFLPRILLSPIFVFHWSPSVAMVVEEASSNGISPFKAFSSEHTALFWAVWLTVNGVRWVVISWALSFYFSAASVYYSLFSEGSGGRDSR